MRNYKTMQEISEELHVSKQTVFRCIRDNNIKESAKRGNAFVYDLETSKRIKELLGFKEPYSNEEKNSENNIPKEDNKHSEAQEELYKDFAKEREELREDYREQLKSKDKQIEELHKLLSQQQQLALVNYQKIEALELELKEDKEQEESKEEKQEVKKGFWSRFKNN